MAREVEELTSHHTDGKEHSEKEGGGGEEQNTPFTLRKHSKETTVGLRKKKKLDKQARIDQIFLTKGDLDEINDKVRETITELWN